MAASNESPQPLLNFYARLKKNPSYRSVHQLWDFLKSENLPMTPDGCFLAYKAVRGDLKDCYSGTFDNSPGTVNEMPRNEISDDPHVSCHEGFHVGAMGYVGSFGGSGSKIVVCKVDPADVVCVPFDSSSHKMRVCRYKVVGFHGQDLPSDVLSAEIETKGKRPVDPDIVVTREKGTSTSDIKRAEKSKTVVKVGTATSKMAPERKVPKKFSKLMTMGVSQLLEQTIDTLREFAFKGLQIVGASKIPGGKVALVSEICKVRDGTVSG